MNTRTASVILWTVAMVLYFMALFAFDEPSWRWMCGAFMVLLGSWYLLYVRKGKTG